MPRSLIHENEQYPNEESGFVPLLHSCFVADYGREEMNFSSYCDNHGCHQPLCWPRTAKSYRSPGPTPSKEELCKKMRGTELGMLFCLHLWERTLKGSSLAKGQTFIADFVISPVENMPLPPRIQSRSSKWLSFSLHLTFHSLFSLFCYRYYQTRHPLYFLSPCQILGVGRRKEWRSEFGCGDLVETMGDKKSKTRRKQMLHNDVWATNVSNPVPHRLRILLPCTSCSLHKDSNGTRQQINTDNTQAPSWAERIWYITSWWYCSPTGTWCGGFGGFGVGTFF